MVLIMVLIEVFVNN